MAIITPAQLDQICLVTLENSTSGLQWVSDCLTQMYLTGCRPADMFRMNAWSFVSDFDLQLLPSKKNLPRYFPIFQWPIYCLELIEAGLPPFYPYSARRLLMYYKRLTPIPFLICGAKDIETYIFRHNYIKQLYIQGASVSDISTLLGYSSDTVTLGYINSVIESI